MVKYKILGVNICAVQIKDVLNQMERYITSKGHYYICVTNVSCIVYSIEDKYYNRVLNKSSLVVPDGMPLVWMGRLRKINIKKRVYGPDLLLAFCELSQKKGYTHYFYGGGKGVPERMIDNLRKKFPNLKVKGCYSPPYRSLGEKEDKQIIEMINLKLPDVLWIGLGYPKQEIWMYEHLEDIHAKVMVGIGAAFDFLAGNKKQAPKYMQDAGLEWLFRLFQEPKRLAKRYIVGNLLFIIYIIFDLLKIKKYNS